MQILRSARATEDGLSAVICYLGIVVFSVLALASFAHAQKFDNGTTLGCDREGFINLRTDLNGKPNDPNEGKEVMKVDLAGTFSWTVSIPPNAVKKGELLFQGSTATSQSGTGNIVITFTSTSPAKTLITVTATSSFTGNTVTTNPQITSFVLRPEYKAQPKKVDCAGVIGGDPTETQKEIEKSHEIKTKHKENPSCKPEFEFEDCASACDIEGDVSSSGNLRVSIITWKFGSSFHVISQPKHSCLDDKEVQAEFTAKEKFAFKDIKVHCVAFSGGLAKWEVTRNHTTDAVGVTPPADGSVTAFAAWPAGIGSTGTTDDSIQDGDHTEGVKDPQTAKFKINATSFNFYKVQEVYEGRAQKVGSTSVGNMTYAKKQPFIVRIVPKPLF